MIRALVGSVALLAVSSCAHVTPIWHDVEDCASPAIHDAEANLIPAVVAILQCDGGSAAALPACAIAGLEGLAASLGSDGLAFVDCVVSRIRDGVSAGPGETPTVRARAGEWIKRRTSAGVTVKAAP